MQIIYMHVWVKFAIHGLNKGLVVTIILSSSQGDGVMYIIQLNIDG